MFSISRNLPTLRRRLPSIPVANYDVTSNRSVSSRLRPRKQTLYDEFVIDEPTSTTYMDRFNNFPPRPGSSRRAKNRVHKAKLRIDDHAGPAEEMEAYLEAVREEGIQAVEPERAMYTFRATDRRDGSLFQDVHHSVRTRRLTTLRRVQRVLDNNFDRDSYKVEMFGSTRNGLSSSESDLDIVVLDPKRPNGYVPDDGRPLPGIYNARRLGTLLKQAGFTEIEPIPWAATPIVKFKDPVTSLNCDLNVNERLGVFNSDLISTYCNIFPPLRPFLNTLKSWAKSRDLNNPSPPGKHPRSFSSYSLVIMTLGFLQVRGYVPNLQAGLPDKGDSRLEYWIRRPRPLRCDCRFFTEPPLGWKPPKIPEDELLRGWFRFWGNEFNYNEHTLSISRGGIVGRELPRPRSEHDVGPSKKKQFPQFLQNPPLCVIDPFIPTKNLVVSVAPQVIARFAEECGAMATQLD